jgi:plasmid replication initiation protein
MSNLSKVLKSHSPKVYKNKKLNNANFGNFTLNDYQVFLHLVSKIGGVDELGKYLQPEQLQREHVLTAKEFSNTFKVDIHYCYKLLKQAADKLMETDIKVEMDELKKTRRINICSMAEYNEKGGSITIVFTDHIMPYLAQVREKYVLYNLKEIAVFSSLYTTRLYELIQEFKETGWVLKSVNQLRELFAVGDKLGAYGIFKRKTFAHACQEINDKYDINLRFEEFKEGRKITAVKFFFDQVVVTRVVNQRTGKTTNIYSKPKPRPKLRRKRTNDVLILQETDDILLLQNDVKQEAKPIKDIFASLLSKVLPNKKS